MTEDPKMLIVEILEALERRITALEQHAQRSADVPFLDFTIDQEIKKLRELAESAK